MKLRKVISASFILGLIFLFPFFVNAQNRVLSKDKAQIIKLIFKKWKFKESDDIKDESETPIYLLNDNVSAEQIPIVKDINFVILNENQIDEMKKTGVKYYSFSEFTRNGKIVRVTFGVNYFNSTKRYSWDSFTEYICYKISGKWKIKVGEVSNSVGESF